MLQPEMTPHDLNQLQQFRIERFLQFFTSSLQRSTIHIDADNVLVVHCSCSAMLEELMDELEDLRSHALLILGVTKTVFYFCQEEVLNTETFASSYSRSSL